MIGLELLMACAPNVAPETIKQIIQVESQGNPLALNVNGGRLERKPRDAADAAALAKQYIANGYSVDLGLMQVNSRNLAQLGYRIDDMFDPCKNIAAGGRVLTAFYTHARVKFRNEQVALLAALSAYNTGNFINGFTNGYVARYHYGSRGRPISLARVPAFNPFTATTAVFIRKLKPQEEVAMKKEDSQSLQPEHAVSVISRSPDDADVPGVQVEYSALEAEQNGVFEETAMNEREAWESNAMLDTNNTAIVVGGRPVGSREGKTAITGGK